MRTKLAVVLGALALGAVGAVTAAPPAPRTVDEAAITIDEAADHIVAQHLAQPLGAAAGTLEAQRRDTGLSWGKIVVAHRLARATDLTFDQIVQESARGAAWDAIAQSHGVDPATLLPAITQARYALETEPSRSGYHSATPDGGAAPGRSGGGGGAGGRRR
jgi:hypothetical protein